MHPGMIHWWKQMRRAAEGECGAHWGGGGGCGPSSSHHSHGWEGAEASAGDYGDFGGGAFGVRRPLRFLAHKLELNEQQVGELARILNELKTERAQADVDGRRTVAAFADAIGSEAFDHAKVEEGAALRVKSAERVRDAVVKALGKIHALLDANQRAHLAYLIRTGTLTI